MAWVYPFWVKAGLTVQRKGEDVFEREMPLGMWTVPSRIELDEENDRLLWWPGGKRVESSQLVLTEFLALGSDASILAYAQKWGVLATCKHGWPATHNPAPVVLGRMTSLGECRPVPLYPHDESERGPFVEPLESWQKLIAKVKALVDVEAKMRLGDPATPEQWRTAMSFGPPELTGFEFSAGTPWMISGEVSTLLQMGNVRPTLVWYGDRGYSLEFRSNATNGIVGSGLFGAIALQLAFSFARSEDLAFCAGCGRAFAARESRAKTGENRYCATCQGDGTAVRDRQRRYRARKKLATTQP